MSITEVLLLISLYCFTSLLIIYHEELNGGEDEEDEI